MMEAGLNVTINTDDPSVSRITLSHEYQHVCEDLHMPHECIEAKCIACGAGMLSGRR